MSASTADAFTQKPAGRVRVRTTVGKAVAATSLTPPQNEASPTHLRRLSQELQAEIAALTPEQRAAEEAETSEYRKGLMVRLAKLAAKSKE